MFDCHFVSVFRAVYACSVRTSAAEVFLTTCKFGVSFIIFVLAQGPIYLMMFALYILRIFLRRMLL